MSQLATIQSNLPANIEAEADNLLAVTQGHERLLKFVKGEYKVMDDKVPLGTQYIAHTTQLTFAWVKFVDNKVVDKRHGKAADRFVPPKREELGDNDQSKWEIRDGEMKDPWSFQHLLPLEDPETGEVVIFTTSSIGGQVATQELVRAYAQRVRRKGSSALPIVELAVAKLKTRKFGDVARPHFEVTGWEDTPSVDFAARADTIDMTPPHRDDEIPPHTGEDLPF
jgi:hypothetical protein